MSWGESVEARAGGDGVGRRGSAPDRDGDARSMRGWRRLTSRHRAESRERRCGLLRNRCRRWWARRSGVAADSRGAAFADDFEGKSIRSLDGGRGGDGFGGVAGAASPMATTTSQPEPAKCRDAFANEIDGGFFSRDAEAGVGDTGGIHAPRVLPVTGKPSGQGGCGGGKFGDLPAPKRMRRRVENSSRSPICHSPSGVAGEQVFVLHGGARLGHHVGYGIAHFA